MNKLVVKGARVVKNAVVTAPLVTVGAGVSMAGATVLLLSFWRWRKRGKPQLEKMEKEG
jgi:hypothetical protein